VSDKEAIERSIALTLKMLNEMFPGQDGQPNPMGDAMRKVLEDMRDPEKFGEMARKSYAGATVTPVHPFNDREVVRTDRKVADADWKDWVEPLHMLIPSRSQVVDRKVRRNKSDVTPELVTALLGDFNWRTRAVGAYLAAVSRMYELFPFIGNMLLQSEVCCVGRTYTVVLASLSREFSVPVYLDYLKYYLTQPQYDFDQLHVYAALLSQTQSLPAYEGELVEVKALWDSFTEQQRFYTSRDIEEEVRLFEDALSFLVNLRDA
jgi:hypothetical protein